MSEEREAFLSQANALKEITSITIMNFGEGYLFKKLAEEQKKTNDRVDAEYTSDKRWAEEDKRREEAEKEVRRRVEERDKEDYEQYGLNYDKSHGIREFIDKLLTGITEQDRLDVARYLESKKEQVKSAFAQLNHPKEDAPQLNESEPYEEEMSSGNENFRQYTNEKIEEYNQLMAKKFARDLKSQGLTSIAEAVEKAQAIKKHLLKKGK
jgi:hypothetical protein